MEAAECVGNFSSLFYGVVKLKARPFFLEKLQFFPKALIFQASNVNIYLGIISLMNEC